MDPKAKLQELKARLIDESIEQLEQEVSRLEKLPSGKFQCEPLSHAIKLCFQVESLLALPSVK